MNIQTRREEVRETFDKWRDDQCFHLEARYCSCRDSGYCVDENAAWCCFVETLSDLGVCIKVEGELPEIKKLPEQLWEGQEFTRAERLAYLAGIKDYQEKVAGYTQVASLIPDKEDK